MRALAALSIVILHARGWHQFNFEGKAVIGIWANIAQVGPDIFFMISGFILMNSTWNPLNGWRSFLQFLKRRFLRIYPTYWVVGIPVLLFWCWNPSWWKPSFAKDPHHLWGMVSSSLFLLPQRYTPIFVVAWTVIYEIYFYLVVSFIFLLRTRGRLVAASFWFFLIVLVNFELHMNQKPLLRVMTSPLNLEFITGMFLAAILRLDLPRLRNWIALAGCLLAVSLIFWATMSYSDMAYFFDHQRWRVFCFGPAVTLLVAICLWMEKQGNWTVLGKLSFVGDRSYSLYLLHVPIYQAVFKSVAFFQPQPSALIITLATLLAMAIMVPATELLYQKVELPSLKLSSSRRRAIRAEITPFSKPTAGE